MGKIWASFKVSPEMKVELYLDAIQHGQIKEENPMSREEAETFFGVKKSS